MAVGRGLATASLAVQPQNLQLADPLTTDRHCLHLDAQAKLASASAKDLKKD